MTDSTSQPGLERAPLHRPWLAKIVIITLVLIGFGGWGLYDAVSLYPKRGEAYASYAEWQYLQAAEAARREDSRVFLEQVAVVDPQAELERLNDTETSDRNREDQSNPASSRHLRATMQVARLEWLEALRIVDQLDPAITNIANPRARLEELSADWATRDVPKPLHWYDIPSQWLIMVVCWAIGLYLLFLLLKTMATKYLWDAGAERLTIPGGASFGADDLAEPLDKRKWDKFVVFASIKGEHDKLGGKSVRFDTYRHAKLESWLLAMEAKAFPDQAEENAGDEPAENDDTPSAAG
ncbi:MAG: hypothetical protein AAFP26_01375 [Planctomycetota bacterium]